ncbi:3-hydroxyacyl-[acyl-carrier-protein] dehydratase FabZ, partial [Acinetobacter baumannii]
MTEASNTTNATTSLVSDFNIKKILDLLPHRYPMLLVDRVVEFESGKRIKAIKNVTFNEPFFNGHFP